MTDPRWMLPHSQPRWLRVGGGCRHAARAYRAGAAPGLADGPSASCCWPSHGPSHAARLLPSPAMGQPGAIAFACAGAGRRGGDRGRRAGARRPHRHRGAKALELLTEPPARPSPAPRPVAPVPRRAAGRRRRSLLIAHTHRSGGALRCASARSARVLAVLTVPAPWRTPTCSCGPDRLPRDVGPVHGAVAGRVADRRPDRPAADNPAVDGGVGDRRRPGLSQRPRHRSGAPHRRASPGAAGAPRPGVWPCSSSPRRSTRQRARSI